MDIDIIIRDSKGITEYTKEESENPLLEKQMKIARGSLEMVVKKLCIKYPLLQPAIRAFAFTAVKEDIILETDGIRVFYQPEKIQKMYAGKELKILEGMYLHLVIHGLLGHFYIQSQGYEDVLWNAILDYEVNMIATSMTAERIDETKKKRPGTRGLYWYAKKKAAAEANLKNYKVWDRHEVWERDIEKKIGSLQMNMLSEKEEFIDSQSGESDDEQGMSLDIRKDDKGSTAEKIWKEIRDVIGFGRDFDQKKLKGMLKGNLYGRQLGEDEEVFEAMAENGNSYRDYIIQFVRERESMKEKDGTIDKMLYSFGFELYGDVAFIEPEEYSEHQKLNMVVIAIDTSGSCYGEIMNKFLRETKNLLQDISEISSFQKVVLMQCDTNIQLEEHFHEVEEFPEETSWRMKGFGGTDFCPVFKRAQELAEDERSEIDFIVYFSDGQGSFPKEEPEYPVFFVLPEQNSSLPEWVTPIYMSENN